jgi:hypothetical protein
MKVNFMLGKFINKYRVASRVFREFGFLGLLRVIKRK